MHKEISRFLKTGQEAISPSGISIYSFWYSLLGCSLWYFYNFISQCSCIFFFKHAIREYKTGAAYEISELFYEFVLLRVSILEGQR
uniref:Uncharacterized protein n=1 Tax=Nelumbo nucifera TaxID=4432 RepID=A0A822YRT9_NELNU|nr:TPA_asm: hypothetical protein HUJ06_006002 [Nelumbo nucifera]